MKLFCLSYDRRYMAGILPLRRKTQDNQSINRYMRMYNFLSMIPTPKSDCLNINVALKYNKTLCVLVENASIGIYLILVCRWYTKEYRKFDDAIC